MLVPANSESVSESPGRILGGSYKFVNLIRYRGTIFNKAAKFFGSVSYPDPDSIRLVDSYLDPDPEGQKLTNK